MNIELLDQVNELQHEERKTKAILDSFIHAYIDPEKETVLKAIERDHQHYTYTASVILDLVCSVIRKTETLEKMISKDTDQSV